MSKSTLLKQYQQHISILEEELKRMIKTQRVEDRNAIEKGETIGNHIMQSILIDACFLRKISIQEFQYNIVSKMMFPHLEKKLEINQKNIKRVLFKLFQENKFEEIHNISEELITQIQEIIKQNPFAPINTQAKPSAFAKQNDNQSQQSYNSSIITEIQSQINISNQQSIEYMLQTSTILSDQFNEVKSYLNKQVIHSKTQITQFCHQFKIPNATYERIPHLTDPKLFKCRCIIVIPQQQRDRFIKTQYSDIGCGVNTKVATSQAAKKVLFKWKRFKEIKKKKNIST